MADRTAFGDLNDANNMAAYQEALAAEAADRDTLKQGAEAEKALAELPGKMVDNLYKGWSMARKNPLGAIFALFSSSEAELGAIGSSLSAMNNADEVRRRQAQAQQNNPPPP